MTNTLNNRRGITLIEVTLAVIIAGILATVAFRSGVIVNDTARTEETKTEMVALAQAITGNPELHNNGVRSDFGYVGDVGSLPPNLDALVSNPGGYATWNGPYIRGRFSQIADDHKTNGWGKPYTYDGLTITSPGTTVSGGGCGGPVTSGEIVRRVAENVSDITSNTVRGAVLGKDGTVPGPNFRDSISIRLTVPDGSGGINVMTTTPDNGGNFAFNPVPIGNHDLDIVYDVTDDTLRRGATVLPNSETYTEYYLPGSFGSSGGAGTLELVSSSESVGGAHCEVIQFSVINTGTSDITISSLTLTWSTPTAYYHKVTVGGSQVFNQTSPRNGSGDAAGFSSPVTIAPGETVAIVVDQFRSNPTGSGSWVNMTNTEFTVDFGTGSTIAVTMGSCS